MELQDLIHACKREEPAAQKLFYDRFAPHMMGVCMRYTGNRFEAEDILVRGMYKALSRLDQFDGRGHFEGWLRRIFVNEALMWIRKKDRMPPRVEVQPFHVVTSTLPEDKLAEEDILKIIEQLPDGYRTVFNLYVIEGYKHREIAELLDISINTSKSQLLLARKKIIALLEAIEHPDVDSRKK